MASPSIAGPGPATGNVDVTLAEAQTQPAADAPEEPPPHAAEWAGFSVFWRTARGFWSGGTARIAWSLTAAIAGLIAANLVIQLGLTDWGAKFFDSLEKRDSATAYHSIVVFLALVAACATATVALLATRMTAQVRWRTWLSRTLMERWLSDQRFYRVNIIARDLENPEYRIAEDTRMATEPLVDFAIGLTTAVVTAIAFIGMLWIVGGAITVELLGRSWTIPGFMVWVALIYAVLISGAMIILGRPLIRHVDQKNESEAQYRFELTRVRESAESIAIIGGEEEEKQTLRDTIATLVQRWRGVVRHQARTTWLSSTHAVLMPTLPILLGAPKFLSGELSLGSLMQVAAAFVQVQIALNWIVDNYIRIADWLASVTRVATLLNVMDDLDDSVSTAEDERITIGPSADQSVRLVDLSLAHANGRMLMDGADVVINKGERVLVTGESGTGKSTLIRAIAGLWPWGSGQVLVPENAEIAFMPQRPYMPLGTLRQALLYPNSDRAVSDEALLDALRRCGLGHIGSRLDEEDRWDRFLSGGEQQRLAFVRVVIAKPDIIIMDEGTSALDEPSQAAMMELMLAEVPEATIISVGHRPSLEAYHDRKLVLQRQPRGARLRSERPRGAFVDRMLQRAARAGQRRAGRAA